MLILVSRRTSERSKNCFQASSGRSEVIGPNGKIEILPTMWTRFFTDLLSDLRAGYYITIFQNQAQSTSKASKLLGMSREFLVEWLKKAKPLHIVGTHRRMYARDVLAYKAERDLSRRKTLDDLARAEYAEGLYDQVPDDFNPGQ